MSKDPPDWHQIQDKGRIHAVENSRSISDDLELQLPARANVKTLCENKKASI